jgi:hypothetical protein
MTAATTDDNPHLADAVRAELYALYGDSELGRQELQAELLEESSDAVVQLAWIWQAIEREAKGGGTPVIGLDVARFGTHRSSIVVSEDTHVLAMEERRGQDLMQTVGWLLEYVERFGALAVGVDDTGLGGGVTDRLTELMTAGEVEPFLLVPVQFAARASDFVRFHNQSSEMWWRLREHFKPDAALPMALPGHHPLMPRLEAQLSGARYAVDSTRRIWVDKTGSGRYAGREEGPTDTEGESPDLGDALALALEAWVQLYAGRARSERMIYQDSFLGRR